MDFYYRNYESDEEICDYDANELYMLLDMYFDNLITDILIPKCQNTKDYIMRIDIDKYYYIFEYSYYNEYFSRLSLIKTDDDYYIQIILNSIYDSIE